MLSRSIDHEIRNVLLLTRINIPLLQVLGVRFIITNEKLIHPETKFIISEDIDDKYGSLYLYEILFSNTGVYSPKLLLLLKDYNTFRQKVIKQSIDFKKVAYVSEKVSYRLKIGRASCRERV